MSVPLAATIAPADGSAPPTRTHTVDISESGVMLACVGLTGTVKVVLTLPGGSRLVVHGTVVRTEPGRTAVSFAGLGGRELQALRKVAAAQAIAA